jgi:hypothetical protein
MKLKTIALSGLLAALAGSAVARFVYNAAGNRVSLDVEGMPVREVVKKIHRQTWEDIRVHKDVDGLVTLHCEGSPLEVVLERIGQQVGARPSLLYPIYRTKESRNRFLAAATGEATPSSAGWTNYESQAAALMMARIQDRMAAAAAPAANGEATLISNPSPGGMGGPFGGGSSLPRRAPISLNLSAASLDEATVAIGKQSQALVVPEDGLKGSVTVISPSLAVTKAVAKIASQTHRQSDHFYLLDRPGRRMAPEVRNQIFAANGGDRPVLTPEQRRQRFEDRANAPGMDDVVRQRTLSQAMTLTPEQRAMRGGRFGRGGPGGPGNPGGPPPGGPDGASPAPGRPLGSN